MRIAVNTQLLGLKHEGIGWFQFETLRRLVPAHPEHRFFFIFDRPWPDACIFSSNITPLRTSIPSRHPILWYLRFHHLIPALLKKHRIDLFLSPDGFNVPASFPSYNVIHDLNFEHFPKNLPSFHRQYYRHFFPQYARNACRLGTVSEYSRQDLAKTYGIDPARIDLLCNAAGEAFRPLDAKEQAAVRDKLTGGKPYFLFVGALNPRKNVAGLLAAFDRFCDNNLNLPPIHLVISGNPMFTARPIQKAYRQMNHREKVLFTGHQGQKELARVMGAALALVFPSTFEGFGIPIVEAMHCDVPVITSGVTAMPEIAGDAALLVDPGSTDSMARALERMARDEKTREQLIMKGRDQREKYSWERAARVLWAGMEKCL